MTEKEIALLLSHPDYVVDKVHEGMGVRHIQSGRLEFFDSPFKDVCLLIQYDTHPYKDEDNWLCVWDRITEINA